MAIRIQIRNDVAQAWTDANPVLMQGEMGNEIDTGRFKVGDGVTDWINLPYSSGEKGDKGDKGDSGWSGYSGPPGTPGTPGHIGDSGYSGISGYSGYSGESVVYTNPEGSVIAVGGIEAGTTFNNTTFSQFVDMLLYPELFPTLTNPSSTFTASVTGYAEAGAILGSIVFNSAFNRGSINPQYDSTSPYRSGLPNTYIFTGTGLSNVPTTNLTDTQTINNYPVVLGNQSWTGKVAYDAGVQPKSSYGADYDVPLPAGETSTITRTITGVYPYYATTVDITTLTKQALTAMNSAYVQTNVVAESLPNKQTVDFPVSWSTITGIQFYNTVSSTWEWINGSKANSLLTFTQTATTYTIQGNLINYVRYTHNGSLIGARQLRWYTT